MRNIEDILALCIEDIKSGRTTIEECLAQYASVRGQLEPLLRLALNIQKPPSIKPSDDFKIRARVRLMESIRDSRKSTSWNATIFNGLVRSWNSGWLKTAAIVMVIVIVLSASGTGTAYASQDSLPGESLYPVKIITENVRKAFTFNNQSRIELELAFASTRLEEMEALASKNPDEIASAARGYEKHMSKAVEKAEEDGDVQGRSKRLETIALEISNHLIIIDGIYDAVTSAEKASVQLAAKTALGTQLRALQALAPNDPMRAIEINFYTMQNRLKRAGNAIEDGMINEVENALGQFEEMYQFGQEISRMAIKAGHDTAVIDALQAQAASERQDINNRMHGKSPHNKESSAEDDGGTPTGDHGKDTGGHTGQGQDNDIPATSDNSTQVIQSPQEEPTETSEDPDNSAPGNGNGSSDNPGEPPDEPGSPPEDPGNGNGGSDNGKK